MIYSLYIFDRHCTCVYYQDWHRSKRPKPAAPGNLLPGVSRTVESPTPRPIIVAENVTSDSPTPSLPPPTPRSTLNVNSGVVVSLGDRDSLTAGFASLISPAVPQPPAPLAPPTGLPFDEEAKLVYGVILSLRNMVKKLSGRPSHRDETFVGYRTSTYKLHLFETLSGYKFIMLSDPAADSLRFVLRQIYSGPFIDYVVRNPLIQMDSRTQGIDNENFRASTDRLVRNLSVYAS